MRSLLFYRRTHASVIIGAAVGTAILVGALAVGDSVRYSLKRLAVWRLGKTRLALVSGDRFFRAELADEVAASLGVDAAPLLQLRGTAARTDAAARANHIQVLGIDERFVTIAAVKALATATYYNQIGINRNLAARLDLKSGDEFILRIEKPGFLPRDVPFSADTDSSVALRLRVARVVADAEFGRFSLRANQVAPETVFVPLAHLSQKLDLPGQANVILLAGRGDNAPSVTAAQAALAKNWRLDDAGLKLRRVGSNGGLELVSRRVFLEKAVADAGLAAGHDARGILSYFVNEIRFGKAMTPYSVVSAPGDPLVPPDMTDDEIIINDWLARDLGAGPGDSVELAYYVLTVKGLDEKTSVFTVRAIVPITGPAADRDLMPELPGLADAGSCRDWHPGMPIHLNLIRAKDEDYWDTYRGTPKAFVTLGAAKRMWANRFGNLTAVRYAAGDATAGDIAAEILKHLQPASVGLVFRDVRSEGVRAASQSVDFAQLFLGLSFFLIAGALLLTGLLFLFMTRQRREEIGTLLAVGFPPARVRRLLLAEGAILAVLAAAAGTILGAGYNQAVLYALGTLWRGAVGTSALNPYIEAHTLAVGALCGTGMAVAAMWLALRSQAAISAGQLQQASASPVTSPAKGAPGMSLLVACGSAAGVFVVLLLASPGRDRQATGTFFAAGSLVLVGSLALCNALFAYLGRAADTAHVTIRAMGLRNSARRKGRSLATTAMLACGVFLVIAIGANRRGAPAGAGRRDSGTGGFALFGETSIPVPQDLDSPAARRLYGLDSPKFDKVRFVAMRVHEGDDASCLNLNRTAHPRILAVDPEEFARRGSFTFVKTSDNISAANPWTALDGDFGPDTVPAVADETVIVWGLGKKIGDTLSYTDENGRPFNIKLVGALANSIFQGSVIISRKAFLKRFPSASGSRVFLVDAPGEDVGDISRTLSRALQDFGLEVTPAARRLARFNTVENTYLTIFLALGGLGLVLGSVGMGVVVLRNVLERRGELALLRAVGFDRKALFRLLLWEHWLLLVAGLVCGTLAALIAVLPALTSPGTRIPWGSLAGIVAAVTASGAAWTYIATALALRGNLIGALRNE